tara:strand:+ start:8 stop:1036 length:1029 start_codon:yes stop_codon:yes gene_type:complete
MESLNDTQLAELASQLATMQLASLQVANEPSSSFDVAIKSYVDKEVKAADTRLDLILAGAGTAYDTLNELKIALDSGDVSITTALTNQIGTERTERKAADVSLGLRIDGEASARVSAVSGEASARSSADSALSAQATVLWDKIEDEEKLRASSDTALGVRIDEEATARISSDAFHSSNISIAVDDITALGETVSFLQDKQSADDADRKDDLVQAVGQLTELLESEAGSRGEGVTQVADGLTQEIADRESAVSVVQSAVNSEAETRAEQTAALSGDKLDVSTKYEKRLDGNFAIAGEDAYLYIGSHWRIRANSDASSKRLEFEYSSDASLANFKTAVPFIRGV